MNIESNTIRYPDHSVVLLPVLFERMPRKTAAAVMNEMAMILTPYGSPEVHRRELDQMMAIEWEVKENVQA